MKIYTSYFGACRKLPKDFVQVAICGGLKFPWNGLRYTKLAPKMKFFTEWKMNHDNDFYIRHFNDEVLSVLTPQGVRKDLAELAGGEYKTVVLLCYEKPNQFCHRHLVAKWLGDDVREWIPYRDPMELCRMIDKAHEATKGSTLVFK